MKFFVPRHILAQIILSILQICKNVIKAAVEGERKLNKQVVSVIKKSDAALKHNWITERPRMSWDFHIEGNTGPCQSL